MARLCIEYETDIQGSQRKRPAGLLDALEHSDQPNEEEAVVGEEKVWFKKKKNPFVHSNTLTQITVGLVGGGLAVYLVYSCKFRTSIW